MRLGMCILAVAALAQAGPCLPQNETPPPSGSIFATGNSNNLYLLAQIRPGEFAFWQRDARGLWHAGGLGQGKPTAAVVWREDLLVFFEGSRWGRFGLAGETKIYPAIAAGWTPVAACADDLSVYAFGWNTAGDPILATFEEGVWKDQPVGVSVPRDRALEVCLARFQGRLYIVWREEAEPLVGEGTGYSVRFAYLEGDKWLKVPSRLRVASPVWVAAEGARLIALYRTPGEGGAAGPWTLAAWRPDDADWHETGPVVGTIPEGPLALAHQGSQFWVAVLTEEGPQLAALDAQTGRLEPFAPPAFESAPSKGPSGSNVALLVGLVTLVLLMLVLNWQRAKAVSIAPRPAPSAVTAPAVGLAPAPALRRAIAGLLDHIIIFMIYIPLIPYLAPTLYGLAQASGGQPLPREALLRVPPQELWAVLGAAAALVIVYFTVLEAVSGETIGKRLLGLRVVSESGARAPLRAVFLRNLLRLVDAIPAPTYIVGLLVIVWTRKSQRIGDLVGRTMVVMKTAGQAASPPSPM
jgi:uncharacterized RDD family membrane protein YckC